MIIVSYDISDDKLRTKFSKYLSRFGHRIQYSMFEIDNSERILNNIICDIHNQFEKKFSQEDSIYIFNLSKYWFLPVANLGLKCYNIVKYSFKDAKKCTE